MKEKYLNQTLSPSIRAKALLEKMSLEEKMGQVLGAFPYNTPLEKLAEAYPQGAGSVSTLEFRRLASVDEVAQAQRKIQEILMGQSPHGIPAIFHMEGLSGGFIQDNVSFPSGIGRASSFDPELEEQIGSIVGRQQKALGITQTFAPILDINRDPRMGRLSESYGEDPTLAASLGAAYTKGVQRKNDRGLQTDAVAKHFLGFHNSEGGIHATNSLTSPRLLREIYGRPFQAAISKSSLRGIMPCYNTIDGEAASVSKEILTDLLRNEMKFDGVVVADYSSVRNAHVFQGMFESFSETGYYAMEAGLDIELPTKECFNDDLMEDFRNGKRSVEILDRAVLRILEAKFRMGLFEHPFALEGQDLRNEFYDEQDSAVSLKSAEESLVLLKNDGTLPLSKKIKKIALIGPHANNARHLFGGYTHISMVEAIEAYANSIAGIGEQETSKSKQVELIPGTQIQWDETPEFNKILKQIKPQTKNLYEELTERLPDVEVITAYGYPIAGNDESHFDQALDLVKEADLVILTLGGKNSSGSVSTMGEGVDSTDINLPCCQERFIIEASKQNIPLVGIHFDGRPISSDVADDNLNAIIEAWNPAEMGAKAIVNVLTGQTNPSGKLPVTVAYHVGQIPIYYNHPKGSSWHQGDSIGFKNYVNLTHEPRYHFGFGLSYTKFEYLNMNLSQEKVQPDGSLEIEVTVKNIGNHEGTEVVQLYITDPHARMVRPNQELVGFKRVHLQVGQVQTLKFTLHVSQLAFLTRDNQWIVEKGTIIVKAGSSSNNIHLESNFEVVDNLIIEGYQREFWASTNIRGGEK